MPWPRQWGANARAATTVLSRLCVEREEVEVFLRQGSAARGTTPAVADVRTASASR